MRDFAKAVDDLDLINAVDAGREAAVYAEDLVVDYAGERQVIEHVCEVMPYSRVAVLATTFGVEAIGLGDAAGLVVAADEVDSLRVAEFKADKERDGLDAKETSIDVVACIQQKWLGKNGLGWVGYVLA